MLFILALLSALVLPLLTASPNTNTTLIYQFSNGTWIENIAVRHNNALLLTLLTTPDLHILDPTVSKPSPTLLYKFPNATALFGIVEYAPDVFAIAAGTYSLSAGVTPHSFSIWSVDFSRSALDRQGKPTISLLAPIPQASFINGMSTLATDPRVLLLGDLTGGQIFTFDTRTRKTCLVVPPSNPLVAAMPSSFGTVGVDGLHIRGHDLYVTNTGSGVLGKLAINTDGTPQADAQADVLARAADGTNWDDFAVDGQGTVFAVTSSGNTVVRIVEGREQEVIAGRKDSMKINQPTAVAFSRGEIEGEKLFVVTGGGALAPGNEVAGGQVLVVGL